MYKACIFRYGRGIQDKYEKRKRCPIVIIIELLNIIIITIIKYIYTLFRRMNCNTHTQKIISKTTSCILDPINLQFLFLFFLLVPFFVAYLKEK